MGEIGKEITKRLYPWGVKILYYDIKQMTEFENEYPNIQYVSDLEQIFSQADIVSLHVPLMKATRHLASTNLLRKMKKGALLVNTSRGPVVDTEALLKLLENEEINIHLAFDVFEQEPIDMQTLTRFKAIKEKHPELKFIFIPHNASADADTRAEMAIIFLQDIITIASSTSADDLLSLKIISEQKSFQNEKNFNQFKISKIWK
jgi:glyoxylate reductase